MGVWTCYTRYIIIHQPLAKSRPATNLLQTRYNLPRTRYKPGKWLNNLRLDAASRVSSVADGTNSASDSHLANSPLAGRISFTNNGALRMTTTKQYDFLNRPTYMGSAPVPGAGSGVPPLPIPFSYTYNTANQRTNHTLADGE